MAVVKTIDYGLDRELRAVAALNGRGVKVGIQGGSGVDPDSGADLVDIAIYTEKHQKAHVQKSKSWATPNAESTKKSKGSDVPLIDNAVMVNAIRYEKL